MIGFMVLCMFVPMLMDSIGKLLVPWIWAFRVDLLIAAILDFLNVKVDMYEIYYV